MNYDDWKTQEEPSYGRRSVTVECVKCHAEREIPAEDIGLHSNLCDRCIQADIERVMQATAKRIARTA